MLHPMARHILSVLNGINEHAKAYLNLFEPDPENEVLFVALEGVNLEHEVMYFQIYQNGKGQMRTLTCEEVLGN
jgi:hypothetical protein